MGHKSSIFDAVLGVKFPIKGDVVQLSVAPSPKARNTLWMFLSCSTASLILLLTTAGHQLQNFRAPTGERITVDEDFQIYYTAGKVARQLATGSCTTQLAVQKNRAQETCSTA